ncbi:IPExxxVDY family protein [Ornithobacterium rhinotracheale]|uniref:IPExxxVDY family protein n=1 Tax=Ornithobacterium rhinotracheale TaxID=28251 RepID=UPI00129C59FF|nr:IPExxxVDY family protein [Ornithobacterium rhinotracheale]MRJ07713.1 IPExxxVDY family protein [Ornithobacterium rhinotracheale]UOH78308.1 IPExxxVDY family protein [Ornithobacterium rhinotracheale]
MSISNLFFEDDYDEAFSLYGILSPNIIEHKFIYLINYYLATSFHMKPDIDVYIKDSPVKFGNYFYYDRDSKNDCFLIQNISRSIEKIQPQNTLFEMVEEQYYLLERYKRYNFLLKLSGNITKEPTFALSLQKLNFVYETELLNLSKTEKSLLIL